MTLDTPLSGVPGLSAAIAKSLGKEGFLTVEQLVLHLPSRHEDRRKMEFKGFSPSEIPVCHQVQVLSTRVMRFGGRRGGNFEAVVEAAQDNPMHQQLTLRWFGMPFLQKAIAVGMEMMVYGKIKQIKDRLVMGHPEYEVVKGDEEGDAEIHTSRIVPIYPLKGALKQKMLRTAIWRVLEHLDDRGMADLLPPPKAGGEFDGLGRAQALRTLHKPSEMSVLEQARRYLALEEFYILQLRVVRRRLRFKHTGGHALKPEGKLLQQFLASLPFAFTEAQDRSLREIAADMAMPQPMNRLLHGDVGSGKTVVALAAMLIAVESGRQGALMAPTQILAEQHYQNALRLLEPLGMRVSLRTGDKKADGGALELFEFKTGPTNGEAGQPHIFIGTHALLYGENESALSKLGLVVIDEQHKFGVAQRARLISRGEAPDVLVMTATPIPRTLTLTMYGDLDVSTIDERPKERGKVITAVREVTKVDEVTKFVRTQIEEGRQCYIVYPLIEESEKLDAGAAVKGHAEWTERLTPHAVGLLHGRMDGDAKEAVMRRFRSGELKALVSTTVIEVGVDVPNATVMLIHDAARFGLAQIHQLRGRIGRGSHTSWCVLFVPKGDKEAKERLHLLEETHDGFRIAEEDLKRRGPGNVLGHAQSGQAPLLFGEMLADTRLITLARRLAERTLEQDPELEKSEHLRLRPLLGNVEADEEVGRQ
ncbi:ATP-dependent DNA helicase RecG [Roseimicrobium gellanilyticum]|uniref:Probable DNA 3'-5' helicase RecG n=1 Tax=Roseimicrobium gellanilyticum TaxID=748857 RepID=A0A366HPK2_9BACT|nr:ATP-dependent DNA helicase RecG [Roseimicrobium gellanilyticum]